MQKENNIDRLSKMFQEHFGQSVFNTESLPRTASGRHYYRLTSESGFSAIGAYGSNKKENEAFIYLSKHFYNQGINVPKIYTDDLGKGLYLMQDLGGESLMDRNKKTERPNNVFPDELKKIYIKTIQELIKIQVEGIQDLDTSLCYPRSEFDEKSMQWDLNYFKYYFLNLSEVEYDEQLLENDFNTLTQYLSKAENNYFLFRDFQSRNVMLVNNEPYLIDYQGGRKGCLQYDLSSLLFQSKANIPQKTREELIDFYFEEINKITSLDKNEFISYFYAFTFIRLIQVLGAYGKRGLIEKMPYFIQSIPLGLKNMEWWLNHIELPIKIPYLRNILLHLCNSSLAEKTDKEKIKLSPLTVIISSFSYKEGLPQEDYPNGGGFVFDCRSIHNPGRYEPYKTQTGRDQAVKDFLLAESHIEDFLHHVFSIVDKAVEISIERNYEKLSVHFGCTGGQHRSVYSADAMAKHIREKYGINIQLNHTVQERKNWTNERY